MIKFLSTRHETVDTFLMVYLNRIELRWYVGEPCLELFHDMPLDSRFMVKAKPAAKISISTDEHAKLLHASKEQRIDFIFKNKDRIEAQ